MSDMTVWIDKLNGMTTEDIHKLMQTEGIKGTQGDPVRCPLAVLLAKKTGISQLRVGTERIYWAELTPVAFADYVYVVTDCSAVTFRHHQADLSASVRQFIYNVDHGLYPELDRFRSGFEAYAETVSKPKLQSVFIDDVPVLTQNVSVSFNPSKVTSAA